MAEINQFLSADAQKEVQAYIASLEVIATKYKDIATASLQLEKAKQEEAKTDNLLIKNKQQLEVLAQKKIKTQTEEQKASERLTKTIEKENSEYEKLKRNHANAVKQTRELAAANKQGTAEYERARASAEKYGKELKKVNDTTGAPATNNVGKYFQAIMKGAGVLGLVTGAAQLAQAGFEKLKTSSQAFGDAFDEAKGGVNAQMNKFFSMLGTGDFSNFIQKMKDAGEAGREYARGLDSQFEGSLSITIKEADSRLRVADLKVKQARAKTKAEQDEFGRQILAELDSITEARLTEAKKVYENERDFMAKTYDINETQFINFLANFRAESDIRDKALAKEQKANQMKLNMYDQTILADGTLLKTINANKQEEYEIFLKTFTNEEKLIIAFNAKYQGLANENIEKAANSYAAFNNILAQQKEESLRTEKKLATNSVKTSKESTGELIKNLEEYNKVEEENYDGINKWNDLLAENFKQKEKEKQDAHKKSVEEFEKNTNDIVNAHTKGLDKEVKSTEEAERLKQQARQKALDMSVQMVSMLFDYQQVRLEAEMASIERYYETRINAAANAGEDTQALEREYEIKRAEIDIELAKSRRNQALVDVAINTAVAISQALFTPWLIPFIATLGAAQAGLILQQPLPEIPAFGTGTASTPDTFIAGERGREIGITKSGKAFITPDQATLYSGMPGTKIIPNQLAELVLKDIGTNVLDRKLDKVISAIEKNQTSVFIDKSLSRSINLKHIRSKHGRN